jgi:hypothetical protein
MIEIPEMVEDPEENRQVIINLEQENIEEGSKIAPQIN